MLSFTNIIAKESYSNLYIKITDTTGIMRINSKIDNNTEFKLISQSVTGLFESETDMLKI